MSPNRKTLKVVGFLQFILGIVGIAVSAQLVAHGLELEGPLKTFYLACGILSIVCGALTVATSFLSIRGANKPSALGPHVGNSIAAAVFGTFASMLLAASPNTFNLIINGVLVLLAVFSAVVGATTKKEAQR